MEVGLLAHALCDLRVPADEGSLSEIAQRPGGAREATPTYEREVERSDPALCACLALLQNLCCSCK